MNLLLLNAPPRRVASNAGIVRTSRLFGLLAWVSKRVEATVFAVQSADVVPGKRRTSERGPLGRRRKTCFVEMGPVLFV